MTAPAVVFDLDGTLIDSLPDLLAAVNRMLGAEGQPPMDRAEVQSYVGDGAPRLVARVMAALEMLEGREDAADWMRRLRTAALADVEGDALDGALATVASFSAEGSAARKQGRA